MANVQPWVGGIDLPVMQRRSDVRPLKRMHFPIAAIRGNPKGSPIQVMRWALAKTTSLSGSWAFRSIIDVEPIISVPINTLVLITGPAGSGKGVQVITPILALVDEPVLYVDPQREAGRDVPLRSALGRYVYVFDPRRADSASTNVLAGISPEQSTFEETVELIVDDLCPEGGADAKSEEGRKYTRLALTVAISNEIYFAALDGREPSLVNAVTSLNTSNIVDAMAYWADHGWHSFRSIAQDLYVDVSADEEVKSGVASYVRRDLSWVNSQATARLVTGRTDNVADPRDMLGDRIKCDWFLQPGENLERTSSLWRVLLGTVRRERRNITEEQAKKIGAPTWFIVDEFPSFAGAGAKTFDYLVVKDRQKRCLPVYICQHEKQIADVFGEGKLSAWQDTASIRLTLAPDYKTSKSFSDDCGEMYKCESSFAGDGNGLQAHSQRQWALTPAVPVSDLVAMKTGDFAAKYTAPSSQRPTKRRSTILDQGPYFLHMPLFAAHVRHCLKKYPYPFIEHIDTEWEEELVANESKLQLAFDCNDLQEGVS